MSVTFPPNSSPRPDQVAVYAKAQQLQQKVGAVADEMKGMDGQLGVDLDSKADAVTISDTSLATLGEKATGSVRFAGGHLMGLSVKTEGGQSLEFRKLPIGANAYIQDKTVVVTSKDGTMKVEEHVYGGVDQAIESMRPQTLDEKALTLLRRTTQTGLGAAAGAVPVVGFVTNFALGSSGWGSGDSRVGYGILGCAANAVGSGAALLNHFDITTGINAFSHNTAVVALGLSALCAAGSAFIASDKRA